MENNHTRHKIDRFLILSFIGLMVFSILTFGVLRVYLSGQSADAIYNVGNVYMGSVGEQLAKHFETIIELRFSQVEGLVGVVSSDNEDIDGLYQELAYRAKVRNFDYLALCAEDGTFETVSGLAIQPVNPEPFLQALRSSENRVVIGTDEHGEDVVMFAVAADYPMRDGTPSCGLVAAVPVKYITDTLSLESKNSLLYYHILRPDGTFVIDGSNTGAPDYFTSVLERHSGKDSKAAKEYIDELKTALTEDVPYFAAVSTGILHGQVRVIPMPHSEWYLLMFMPYGALDEAVEGLSTQQTGIILAACGAILLILLLIFARYYALNRRQMQELDEARRGAVAATKAKSEFLSNMSHDIRTPMNAIVGMTAIALTHLDDQEYVQNCLRKVALSGKHLLSLINDVLDMSKIESGRMTLTMDQVSLKEIVEEIVGIVQPQVKAKKQSFDVRIDNILNENVVCDSVRLSQVILNLLSNAVKYTQEGGRIEMTILEEALPDCEDKVRIHIRVRDNGIGMAPEFLNKIFDSYSREDNLRVHKTEGAGLGMAITKYIVDAMGGTIGVQSKLGEGTEFHVTVDLTKAQVSDVEMVLPAWDMLVVDDDQTLCQTAVETLKDIGVHAEWTLSGESALEMVRKRHSAGRDYQIILLDWRLPGMDGIQTAREIRRELGEDVPILLISAYDWSDFAGEARDAGVNGFIAKPLFRSTLFYGLRSFMDDGSLKVQEERDEFDFSGRRVLLAEDNELNWEVASELLSELKLELDWAEDGKICLEKFSQSQPGYYEAILMDIRMPVMNGYEATEAIRALDRPDAATIPIIAMTADAFSEDIQHCLSCGMNAHVAKPINVSEVARLLEKYLGK